MPSWSWIEPTPEGDEIILDVGPEGIVWHGNSFNPNWGGGYSIGFQTLDDFMAGAGDLRPISAEIRAEIRAYVEKTRDVTLEARLVITARVLRPQTIPLWQISISLDDNGIAFWQAERLVEGTELELFAGPILVGMHRLDSAVAWTPPRTGNLVYPELAFDCAPGSVTQLVYEIGDRTATITRSVG